MPTPRPVSKKLREMLGAEAADTMVEWLEGLEVHRDTFRREVRTDIAEVRHEVAALRQSVRQETAGLRRDMAALKEDAAVLRAEMRVGFAELRQEMAAAEARAERRTANLMKWMMGFWVTSLLAVVGAILAIAKSR